MIQFSPQRARKLTLIVGLVGTILAFALRGTRDGAGFAIGAAVSFASIHSWLQLAAALGGEGSRTVRAPALFTALRYLLIGGVIYATIRVLGTSPVAMITGLLASFAAVVLELLYANRKLF